MNKKYQIVTYSEENGLDEKLTYNTLKEAKNNINSYKNYDYIFIIQSSTNLVKYIKKNKTR